MNLRFLLLLCCLPALTFAAPPTSGQYKFDKRNADGTYTSYGVTITNGQLFGLTAGVPAAITGGGGGGGTWGSITGTLADQTDLASALAAKQATITDGSLTIARTNGLQAALDAKLSIATAGTTYQLIIGDGDLTIARTTGLQAALDAKQATITDGSLTIARTNGLQAALDAKLSTATAGTTYQLIIGDGDLTIARTTGLQAALDAKQATITDGSLTIARTNGLQAALDAKQPLSSNLTIFAGITPSSNVQTLLSAANYAAFKASLSLGNVENTALSTWAGSTNFTTAGTISAGTWQANTIAAPYLGSGSSIATKFLRGDNSWQAITPDALADFGGGVVAALSIPVGSAGAPVLFNGAGGTPESITLTNGTGTAASLTAGQASAALGLKTATTTVAVSSATAPSAGQRLTATSSTAADWQSDKLPFVVACSDETTDLTTGTAKVTFRMPCAMTLTSVRLNVNTAPTGSVIIVDVKEAGTTIFSTKPQIAISAKTSVGGAVPGTLSDTSLADDAEITINLDQIGSTIAGKGLKVVIEGTR